MMDEVEMTFKNALAVWVGHYIDPAEEFLIDAEYFMPQLKEYVEQILDNIDKANIWVDTDPRV